MGYAASGYPGLFVVYRGIFTLASRLPGPLPSFSIHTRDLYRLSSSFRSRQRPGHGNGTAGRPSHGSGRTAARAEQEQKALIAQAKAKEEVATKAAEQQRAAEAALKAEQQRVAGAAAKVEQERLAARAAIRTAAPKEVAIIKTAVGEMVVDFWPDKAPNTVANFIKLAKIGFYDRTAFHRIITGFMIQGGDPLSKDPAQEARWGTGSADQKIKAEFNDSKHDLGVISMAPALDPDSGSCQFFICLGPTPQLDGKYTAFGKLIKGEDVLKKLGAMPVVTSASGEPSKPKERVEVEGIKIVPADSIK